MGYNLFGNKLNSNFVQKPEGEASGTGAVGAVAPATQTARTTDDYGRPLQATAPQPSTAVTNGAERQGTVGVKKAPTTSTDPGAIRDVNTQKPIATPTKAEMTSNPVSYVDRFNAEKEARREAEKTAYTPDPDNKGRGVANWITRTFSNPKTTRTKEDSRRAIQAITLVGDVGRHLANLWGTTRGASPMTINSGVEANAARWKEEDAAEASAEKAARDWALKQQAAADKKAYQEGQLALGQQKNQIALGNYEINANKDKRDAEMHPYNIAAKAAGIEQTQANTARTKMQTELEPKKFEETVRSHRANEALRAQSNNIAQQRVNISRANLGISYARLKLAAGGSGKSTGKKGDGSLLVMPHNGQGTKYYLSKDFQNNIDQVYKSFLKNKLITDVKGPDGALKIPTKQEMIDAVMDAAVTSNAGHKAFVYWGKELGYSYAGGMPQALSDKIGGGLGVKGFNIQTGKNGKK